MSFQSISLINRFKVVFGFCVPSPLQYFSLQLILSEQEHGRIIINASRYFYIQVSGVYTDSNWLVFRRWKVISLSTYQYSAGCVWSCRLKAVYFRVNITVTLYRKRFEFPKSEVQKNPGLNQSGCLHLIQIIQLLFLFLYRL